jgi:hypothetical protein
MEPATAFIEKEFKNIGLKPLKGLQGYRQPFDKEKVWPEQLQVVVDGVTIPQQNSLIISDEASIDIANSTAIRILPYDTAAKGPQHFYSKIGSFLRDTTSALMVVAPEYQEGFDGLKQYYSGRFTNKRKYTKTFVIGPTTATTYSIKAKQRLERIVMANVVGVLEGKGKLDEMVVFSGHYDHIGILATVNGDSIANGADDDASGTTAVIELARYFKKLKDNNRTIIFVAFTAEEIGGYGSKYFSEQINAEKVVAMFNIEMIGTDSK